MIEYKFMLDGKYLNRGRTLSHAIWYSERGTHTKAQLKERAKIYFKSSCGKGYTDRIFKIQDSLIKMLLDIGGEVIEIKMCDKGCIIRSMSKEEILTRCG